MDKIEAPCGGGVVKTWMRRETSSSTAYVSQRLSRASSPSRILRRAAKRSEAPGGIVESLTDGIRASGFCGARFRHVRVCATSDSLRSAPHWRQR